MTIEQQTDWRERAVSRSLDRARERAEDRLQRLLVAAEELLDEGVDVTVQEVVRRAGQSLRTFYQHFAGKQELMLALLESGCDELAVELARRGREQADPVQALRDAVEVLHRAHLPQRSPRRAALAAFSAQLLHADPVAYQQVQQRIVLEVQKLVAAAAPTDPQPLRTGVLVLNVVGGASRRDPVLSSQGLAPLSADEVWTTVAGLIFPAPLPEPGLVSAA